MDKTAIVYIFGFAFGAFIATVPEIPVLTESVPLYGKILFFGTDIWIIIHSCFLIITMPFVAIVSLKDRLKAKNKGVVRLPFPFTAGIISGGATVSLILVIQNMLPQ